MFIHDRDKCCFCVSIVCRLKKEQVRWSSDNVEDTSYKCLKLPGLTALEGPMANKEEVSLR